MYYCYTLIPYYKFFQVNVLTSSTNVVFFFFAVKFFDFFSLNWAFSKTPLNSAIMESNTLLLNAFFSAHHPKVSTKLFTGSARISQKIFVSSEIQLWDGRSFSISLCFCFLFNFIFSLVSYILKFIGVLCKNLNNNYKFKLCLFVVETCWMINLCMSDISIHYNIWLIIA